MTALPPATAALITCSCRWTHPITNRDFQNTMGQNFLAGTEKKWSHCIQTRKKWLQSCNQQGINRGGGKKTLDCLQNTKEQGERKGEAEGDFLVSWPLWDFLPHLKTLESPLLWWWWWKQLVLNRSEACLLFCPLLASLPLPLRISSHPSPHSPSWVLLKLSERPSAPGSSQGKGGKFHSVKSDGGGSPQGPEVSSQSLKWSGTIQFHTQQHKHNFVIVLIPAGLLLNPPGWQACQSLSNFQASLTLTVCVSLSSHQTCRATFQLPPWSLPPALRAALSQGGSSYPGWDRWSISYQQEGL